MKRFASFLLALVMALSLAACGEGGLSLNPGDNADEKETATVPVTEEPSEDDSGIESGYMGDKMSTYWFDFTVDSAYTCAEYGNYTASAGNKLLVVTLSLKNTWGKSLDMWGDDFLILWDDGDDAIDVSLPAGISDDQFPDEYVLGINESKTAVSIFEVPEDFRDFAIWFQELYEDETNPDGRVGDDFLVYFTAEEK